MNSLLLLLLLLALIVIFLFSCKKNEAFTDDVSFYPASEDKVMILEDCENIEYKDCLLDSSEKCAPESPDDSTKILHACDDKPIKIYNDMIYGNEYIFIEKPYTIDPVTEEKVYSEKGVILVKFTKTDGFNMWFKVGTIDEFGYTLKKLYKELDESNLPINTKIEWKFNEPIVFIHRQKTERIPIVNNLELNSIDESNDAVYYTLRDGNIFFVKYNVSDNQTPIAIKETDLRGELIDLETKTQTQIQEYYESSKDSQVELTSVNLLKIRISSDNAEIIEIISPDPKLNKINTKTLYFNGDNGWKQTYNPSDYFIDKNMVLLSKLYTNNNEIKNIEKEIDNLIEKINL